ncbi:MAG: hypothetical protein HQL39_09035 [Alphaproteobacteria bacterium]|nr:hypothetical protein [Alphaproteobacteria bacterium]
MIDVVEGQLVFSFPDGWSAEKYDRPNGFVERKCKIDDTKRVDILALSPDSLLLFEVKDFRDHAIENKHRMDVNSRAPLHQETAKKVRDTFAFLFAAFRDGDETLRPFCTFAFGGTGRKIEVILFVEEDVERARTVRGHASRTNTEARLKALLKPFGIRCHVQRSHTLPPNSPWLVRNAPQT